MPKSYSKLQKVLFRPSGPSSQQYICIYLYLYIYIYIYIYLCACICVCKNVYMYLSHKLRCYTENSGPEKNRNNTREKISYFSTCVDNQLLTRHSPLAPPGQVDEGTVKPSRFLIQVVYRSFLKLWRLNTKRSVSLTDSEAQTFLEGEENQYTKRKTESYVFSGFGVSISLGWELRQLEDLPLADFGCLPERLLLSVRTKPINQNFVNWKLRPLLIL